MAVFGLESEARTDMMRKFRKEEILGEEGGGTRPGQTFGDWLRGPKYQEYVIEQKQRGGEIVPVEEWVLLFL
jgi:hypothetical protein